MDDTIEKNIYTDLDTILDTRSVILYNDFKDVFNKVINSTTDNYRSRTMDKFDYIGIRTWSIAYALRDSDVLINAMHTPIVTIIEESISSVLNDAMSKIEGKPPKIYINVYPYILNMTQLESIGMFFKTVFKRVEIVLIHKSNLELSPKWLNKKIAIMYKYDALNFFNVKMITGELLKNDMLSVGVIAPGILPFEIDTNNIESEFEKMSEKIKPFINITFIPVSNFSSI